MAIKISGTTVIDDSRNIENIGNADISDINVTGISTFGTVQISSGIITSTSGIVTYYGDGSNLQGVVSGIELQQAGVSVGSGITAINFDAGATLTTASGGISTITIAAGGGISDGVVFNTGITSIASARLTGIGTTVLTLPSTAGKEYIVYSINASNIAVGNTEVNVIGAFDFVSAGNSERSYFAYNIPVPTGAAVELLRQPQVLNPSNRITMRATDAGRAGTDLGVEVYISYQEKTSTAYFGLGFGISGITTTGPIGIYTSTGGASVLQSIRLANTTDTGGYPISVTVTSGVNTTYLIDDLIVPKYASVEILDAPKALKTNDVVSIIVDQLETIDVQISGVKV